MTRNKTTTQNETTMQSERQELTKRNDKRNVKTKRLRYRQKLDERKIRSNLAEYFLGFLFMYVLTNVFYIPYYFSFSQTYVLDMCTVCTLRQDLEGKGEYLPSKLLAND